MDLLPDAVLRYADHDEAVVDVHLPEQAGGAVVVLVHGGFWKAEWDRRHTRPLARALSADGFVVATPEYRRVGNGGGWPTTADDVRRALTALPDLLGAVGVQPGRTTLVGHSAGGHLVLCLAAERSVDRVVALAPVADLREAARLGLGGNATQAFLGGEPNEVDYDPADPMVRLDDRPGADVVVVHGRADENVPIGLSERLVRRHPWIRLERLDCAHFELIDPADPAYELLRAAL
jgi:acetyl esterase/lipase